MPPLLLLLVVQFRSAVYIAYYISFFAFTLNDLKPSSKVDGKKRSAYDMGFESGLEYCGQRTCFF